MAQGRIVNAELMTLTSVSVMRSVSTHFSVTAADWSTKADNELKCRLTTKIFLHS